jgi:hypothetical protein
VTLARRPSILNVPPFRGTRRARSSMAVASCRENARMPIGRAPCHFFNFLPANPIPTASTGTDEPSCATVVFWRVGEKRVCISRPPPGRAMPTDVPPGGNLDVCK